ncbi:MAG: sigma-54-dependent Fis family transcriptional regulator [Lentisphaerae bacterium GWF2_45_14]|nr:MAG: sigma-54-dependent Fis family transcriptional regulator [Lentisphaerae bacterium GWF2_45_14]
MKKSSPFLDDSYILNKLLESAYDGIVVINQQGIITYISKAYTDFLGLEARSLIGKNVEDAIENTRLPAVLKSGKAEKAQLQLINGDYMIASRFPLIKDGVVIGAIGKVLFRNIEDLNLLHKQISQLQKQVDHYRKAAETSQAKYSFKHIIGRSEKLSEAKSMAKKACMADASVILTGESGTGKELFAHAIHREGTRSTKPFIKLNCAAIPAELLESELFGYEEGAFTGAKKGGKSGKFETADGGTLFLDEIGDMPLGMQSKLLRVLQEKEIEKIGSQYPIKVNVRIIAATNKNLVEMVEKGLFRADLYYRLNVISIRIPPLRERPSDIDLLVSHLLDKICAHLGKYVEISPGTMRVLKSYSWPGNVRQLENVLERAVNLAELEAIIVPEDLPEAVTGIQDKQIKSIKEILEMAEKNAILTALNLSGGKKAKAARLLKISRSNLYERMNKLKI